MAATFIGILFLVLNFYLDEISVLILSIEVLLLPAIYIISNLYIEELIKARYRVIIRDIRKDSRSMQSKLNSLIIENGYC